MAWRLSGYPSSPGCFAPAHALSPVFRLPSSRIPTRRGCARAHGRPTPVQPSVPPIHARPAAIRDGVLRVSAFCLAVPPMRCTPVNLGHPEFRLWCWQMPPRSRSSSHIGPKAKQLRRYKRRRIKVVQVKKQCGYAPFSSLCGVPRGGGAVSRSL